MPVSNAPTPGNINLRTRGLEEVLSEKVIQNKAPCLGICLGMQLLMGSSEEGQEPGLGWIAGRTRKFSFEQREPARKVPHMGWNAVQVKQPNPLFLGLDGEARFYFVHSYHAICEDASDISATTNYGYDFACAVQKGNVLGVQFHPEKSHRFGMRLLNNFVNYS